MIHERDPPMSMEDEEGTWSDAMARSADGRQATCQEQIGCISFVQGVFGLGAARQPNDDLMAGSEAECALDRSPDDIDLEHSLAAGAQSLALPPKDEWDSIGFTDRSPSLNNITMAK